MKKLSEETVTIKIECKCGRDFVAHASLYPAMRPGKLHAWCPSCDYAYDILQVVKEREGR